MAITARLEVRQSQQLVMTPQLQQAIRLLQFSNLELNAFIDAELERNPLLERDETDGGSNLDAGPSSTQNDTNATGNGDAEEWLDLNGSGTDASASLDADLTNVFPETSATDLAGAELGDSGWASLRQRNHIGSEDGIDLDDFATSDLSLKDHLTGQLNLNISGPADRLIGQFLIDMVDEAGYLTGDLSVVADRLGASLENVEAVLARLQTFDPPGVFARTLGECLALQLKDQNRYDPQIGGLLDNLELLASHNLPALRRILGIDAEELASMITEIKGLNPKPGLQFGSVHVQPVVPDVIVRPSADGGWHIELNADTLPRVLVNRGYYSHVSRAPGSTANDKNYLMNCLQTANWLVKSLDQRARTILRVSEEIVRQQDGFFTHGVQYLRPLNLKTVADAISMHESTISRVTSNKYMATPRGVFELKYFFTSAIASAGDGEAHSSEAVRHRIRQMIDGETSQMVLSDDMIVDKLKSDGIDIARRTVAKYREAMRIPSSVQRRREKKLFERKTGTFA